MQDTHTERKVDIIQTKKSIRSYNNRRDILFRHLKKRLVAKADVWCIAESKGNM